MIRIAIVDDEKVIREQIKKLVEKKQNDCEIDTYGTGEDLLKADSVYDIIFLDIQMNGMNGIDTARALRQKADNTVLIFITGVKEYVFDAFDVAAFHYLIKPIEENKFWEVCDRAVLEVTKKKQNPSGQIFIKTRSQSITLEQSDVLYIESRAKKVEIHTKTNIVEAYAAISELEKQLVGSFYRCHRGYLVNMAFIAGYENDSITLNNGETIILSKDKYSEFVKVYMRYLKNGGGIFV
ncbi:MAG: LytR/AlgR family response regulator transcription factor [Ruminococcus sp.]